MNGLLLVALAGLGGLCAAMTSRAAPALAIETITSGLDRPFAMALLADGDILVTEKPGRLRLIRGDRLQASAIPGVPAVLAEGDYAGLQDVVLHPRFAENRLVYLSYVQGTRDANAVRIARGRFDGARLADVEPVFTVAPDKATLNHPGARLAFVGDGTLLMTVGDGFEYREQAQNRGSMLGKVIRITDEGRIPDDNPFTDAAGRRTAIWTYGHRHPQGLLYDAATGRLYEHEHGAHGGDELNLLLKGRNYGWPLATFGISYSGAYVSPYQRYPGTEDSLVHWTPSLAPCGITQCRGCQWPQWEGDLFIGMLGGEQVRRVSLREGRAAEEEALLGERHARIRDLRFGADGALYVLEDGGTLLRVTPGKTEETR